MIITLALTETLRHGGILAIDMDKDINFENNTINIRRSLQKTKDHGLRIKGTKTEEDRTVTLNALTMKTIQERLGHKDIATTVNLYTHVRF